MSYYIEKKDKLDNVSKFQFYYQMVGFFVGNFILEASSEIFCYL